MREDLYIRDGVKAHRDLEESYNELAIILTKKAELSRKANPNLSREFDKEAVLVFKKSLDMCRELYIKNGVAPAHPSVADALHNFRNALMRTEGRTKETDALYNELVEMRRVLSRM